jgi:hypothetical protein
MVKEVPLSEITLRKYERPYDTSKRAIVRKICLSLGLLQPGDSRDVIVDILLALEDARVNRKELSSFDVQKKVKQIRETNSMNHMGLAESNIRRQLKRLRDLMLVDKINNRYKLSEFEPLSRLFEERIEKFLVPQTIERIKDYLVRLEKN